MDLDMATALPLRLTDNLTLQYREPANTDALLMIDSLRLR
jgi:hypothetical protein